jgi:alkylation response protein AidB-like acyl-CoA dehydrogenase
MMNFSLTDTQQLQWESIVDFSRRELNGEIRENDRAGQFPTENWHKCAEMGLLSLLTPDEYGGVEEDFLSTVMAIEAFSYGCQDSGLVHAVVTQLCCIALLRAYGTEEQKRLYLPKLSNGILIAAQALTEPDAGSDIISMRTRVDANGEMFTLSGGKVFISNGPIADLVIVFAKNNEGKSVFGDISCFLVEKDAIGYSVGKPLEKMGLRTLQNSELFFDEVSVDARMMLGKNCHGMFIFNEGIEWERALMAAAHLGTLARVL